MRVEGDGLRRRRVVDGCVGGIHVEGCSGLRPSLYRISASAPWAVSHPTSGWYSPLPSSDVDRSGRASECTACGICRQEEGLTLGGVGAVIVARRRGEGDAAGVAAGIRFGVGVVGILAGVLALVRKWIHGWWLIKARTRARGHWGRKKGCVCGGSRCRSARRARGG